MFDVSLKQAVPNVANINSSSPEYVTMLDDGLKMIRYLERLLIVDRRTYTSSIPDQFRGLVGQLGIEADLELAVIKQPLDRIGRLEATVVGYRRGTPQSTRRKLDDARVAYLLQTTQQMELFEKRRVELKRAYEDFRNAIFNLTTVSQVATSEVPHAVFIYFLRPDGVYEAVLHIGSEDKDKLPKKIDGLQPTCFTDEQSLERITSAAKKFNVDVYTMENPSYAITTNELYAYALQRIMVEQFGPREERSNNRALLFGTGYLVDAVKAHGKEVRAETPKTDRKERVGRFRKLFSRLNWPS